VQEVKHQCLDLLATRNNIATIYSGRNPEAAARDVAASDPMALAYVQLKAEQRALLNQCFDACIHSSERSTYLAPIKLPDGKKLFVTVGDFIVPRI